MKQPYSIGVDLGGTNLRIAAYASGREFLDTVVLPTRLELGRDQVVRDMAEAINGLMARFNPTHQMAGIGVGSPGPLELPEGIIRNPPNLPGWDGFHLRAAIEEQVGVPVCIEGDANVAALAEWQVGKGLHYGVESLCMLTLGTGVGSGFILNGRIWHGVTGMGGEAGHIQVHPYQGAACGCGGFGCLEQYASATAIARMAREQMGTQAPSSPHMLATMAHAGNRQAQQIFEQVGRALAVGLTAVINMLNLPLCLIGGGVSDAWDLFAPTMFAELRSRSYVYRLTEPTRCICGEALQTRIEAAELGSNAGLLGACLLPFQAATSDAPSTGVLARA